MSDIYRLVHKEARQLAAMRCNTADDGIVVTFKKPTRTLDQNAKFHAMCQDIADSGIKWDGERRNVAEWKILLVSGHSIAEGNNPRLARGLENELVTLRESTAGMSVSRLASLIEYTYAWGIKHDVRFDEKSY
jgi:hypothetical protein